MTDQPGQDELPFGQDPADDPLDDYRRPRITAPMERLKALVRQGALDAERLDDLDVVVQLPSGEVKFASEMTDAEVAAGGAVVRDDLRGPWEADEDQDQDGPPF